MTVYHLSHIENRKSILANGLIPKEKTGKIISYSPRIFVSNTPDDCYGYAIDFVGYENVDVWTFRACGELFSDEFSGHKNHFYITKSIPPEKLVLHETF